METLTRKQAIMVKKLILIILVAIVISNIRTIASAIVEGLSAIILVTVTIIFIYWLIKIIAVSLDKIIDLVKKQN